MLLTSTSFKGLASSLARVMGMPDLRMVELGHPIAGIPLPEVFDKLDRAYDEIIGKLTSPFGEEGASVAAAPAREPLIDLGGRASWESLQDECRLRGWSDGLPVIPPTVDRVEAMVRGSGRAPEEVLGVVPPVRGVATVEKLAVNAVMAGCQAQHMPLLVAALKAMLEESFALKNIQATTHPIAPLLIVSGPAVAALNLNAGSGTFGPGPWANGVIGRALRLALLNLGGARPGEIDKATAGQPGKFTFCIAENEAAAPAGWPSLRQDHGIAPDVSTVTLFGGEAPHNINDHESTTAGGLATMMAGAMAQLGQNNVYYRSEMLLLLSPEHAHTFAADGWSRDDLRAAIHEQAQVPMSAFSRENRERRLHRFMPRQYLDRPLNTPVKVVQAAQDVIVVVTGGAGKHSMYLPTTGSSRPVTRVIEHADGTPWRPAASHKT